MKKIVLEYKESAKALIDGAEELFAAYGYEGTSLRMIGDLVNMNPAAINYYFGSKEELYNELFQLRIQMINNKLSKIASMEIDEIGKLLSFFAVYIENVEQYKNFHRILFREICLLSHSSQTKRMVAASTRIHFELLKNIIEAGIKKGVLKKINAAFFTLNVFMLVIPLTFKNPFLEELYCEEGEKKALTDQLTDYFHAIILNIEHQP